MTKFDIIVRAMLGLAFVFILTSCATTGYIKYSSTDTHGNKVDIKVVQPSNAIEPATLDVKDIMDSIPKDIKELDTVVKNDINASTGNTQEVDKTMEMITGRATWLGSILILLCVASLIARYWIKIIPIVASLYLGAFGVGMYMLPDLINKYGLYVYISIAIGVGLYIWGIIDNQNKLKQKDDELVLPIVDDEIPQPEKVV